MKRIDFDMSIGIGVTKSTGRKYGDVIKKIWKLVESDPELKAAGVIVNSVRGGGLTMNGPERCDGCDQAVPEVFMCDLCDGPFGLCCQSERSQVCKECAVKNPTSPTSTRTGLHLI